MIAATEKAQNASVKLHPVATFSTLLDVALEQGRLGSEEIANIATFAENPKEWSV
jgi:orotate phosphoribosyltransferase